MINSFRERDGTRWLSNFHVEPVLMPDGITYPSAEAAYQAHKSTDTFERRRIASLPEPRDAQKEGQNLKLRDDWEEIKIDIMEEVVRRKFNQSSELTEKLLATGTQKLIEGNHWHDTFWGVYNGKGSNHLGLILMRIRKELQTVRVLIAGHGLYALLCEQMPDTYQHTDSRMIAWRKVTEVK